MFLARIVFFRLHESPRYLVHAGRPQEAIESLQMISRFNGSDLSLELDDVRDHHHKPDVEEPREVRSASPRDGLTERPRATSITTFNASGSENDPPHVASLNGLGDGRPPLITQYNSTDASPIALDGHSFSTPAQENPPTILNKEIQPIPPRSPSPSLASARSPSHPQHARQTSHVSMPSRRPSLAYKKQVCYSLPRKVRRPLWAWWNRVMMVLSPEWFRATILVWGAWFFMSLGSCSLFS